MEEITRQVLKATFAEQEQAFTALEKVLTECVEAANSDSVTIESLKKKKASLEQKIDVLIDSLSEGGLNDAANEQIKNRINGFENDISDLTNLITQKEALALDDSFVHNKINEIKEALAELRSFTTIDRDRVLNYIERIDIYENGDIDMTLKSGKTIKITSALPINNSNDSEESGEIIVGKTGIRDALYSSPAAYQALPLRGLPRQ